jgi:uncharacterized protein (DUF3084 family)
MEHFKIVVPGRENQDIDVLNQYHTKTSRMPVTRQSSSGRNAGKPKVIGSGHEGRQNNH